MISHHWKITIALLHSVFWNIQIAIYSRISVEIHLSNIFQNVRYIKKLNNIFNSFIREGIIRCILATDMARHNEILTQFKDVVPSFDYSNRAHINLVIKLKLKIIKQTN